HKSSDNLPSSTPSGRLWIRRSARLLRTYTFAEKTDRGTRAAVAMRDFERIEAYLDRAERAQNHRCIDVAHMGDAEGLALQVADADAEHHAAFFLAIAMQPVRAVIARHQHGGPRVGALSRFADVEGKHLALGPDRDRAPHRLAEQAVALEYVSESFRKQHVDGLAQREQQVHRRGAGIFAVMLASF